MATAAIASVSCLRLPAGKKVDVGGYGLRLHCSGQGRPTVVLDSGLGDTQDSWSEVVPEVQKFTQVCVYDRAGLGRSDPGPTPRTSHLIATELHSLLTQARIPDPYLLVGHSFGGMNIQVYASEHPRKVAGLVLVDATHEDYPARERQLRPVAEKRKIEQTMGMASPAARSEYESLLESASEVRTARPLPDVPSVVITAGQRDEPAPLKDVWLELQEDLARRLPRSRHVFARRSGHYVQFDEPEVIVEAIRSLVLQIRRENGGRAWSPADPAGNQSGKRARDSQPGDEEGGG